MANSHFNYKGDLAGSTYEDYEFEVEDIELDGNAYILIGMGSFCYRAGQDPLKDRWTLTSAEIYDASTDTWTPIAVELVPASWKDAVEAEEQGESEKAQERSDQEFYGGG